MRNEKILVLKGGESTEREVSLRSGAAVAEALRERFANVAELDLTRESLHQIREISPDCAFIALHGKGGEDGTVQGLLEWMGIPYTGPGTLASALCLDKMMTKKVLSQSGVPTPDFLCIETSRDPREAVENAIRILKLDR